MEEFMKALQKIAMITITLGICLSLFGCTKKEDQLEGSLPDLMKELYAGAGIGENDIMYLENIEVTKDNISYYLGVEELDYKEAIASESMVGSIPHSVVLVRMNENADVEKAKKEILEKVNPNKWICVSVEKNNVIVESRGDVIVLIMNNEYAQKLSESFKELGKK